MRANDSFDFEHARSILDGVDVLAIDDAVVEQAETIGPANLRLLGAIIWHLSRGSGLHWRRSSPTITG
jgi:hypothetical protein